MPRRTRLKIPTAIHHVIVKGNGGQNIFFSDADRLKMLSLLQEGTERYDHRILAYCFMNNHIHLAIQVGLISLSKIMQNVGFRYARYVNAKFNRIGHLFQGRFKSILVCGNNYFQELIRYIHLNPIRAGIVSYPEEYFWSSHRAYMTLEEIPWLSKEKLYSCFGNPKDEVIKNYKNFILEGIGIKSSINFQKGNKNGILSDNEFIVETLKKSRIKSKIKIELKDLVKIVCKKFHIREEMLLTQKKSYPFPQIRAILVRLTREIDHLSLETLSQYLNQNATTLCKLALRWENHPIKKEIIFNEVKEIQKLINEDSVKKMAECPSLTRQEKRKST